ncbi:MAG: HDOD domain-containing protein [Nitrospinae bacterium]|nr:HDOD domain-containing protein [Nitrospinota bacterium]
MSEKLSLDTVVRDIDELPSLPAAAMKALEIVRSDGSSASELAEIIRTDQGLTANVLKLCNSAYYGIPQKVDSVQQGIALVGFSAIRNMVVSFAVQDKLEKGTDGYLLGPGDLWRSAVNSAFLAGRIARDKTGPLKDIAFTAGIIHDIGKVVLSKHLISFFDEIVDMVNDKKINFNKAETEVIGFDHAEIGGKIAEKWKFPEDLVESVRHHHSPGFAPAEHQKLVSIIHISDVICLSMGIGIGGDGLNYPMDEHAVKLLSITEADMESYFEYVLGMQETVEQFVS